ncbi:MAG: hypothetical protein JSS96_09825 [Bacteroidetes bacterium]|nr:hypothetical protein [Bacteroidota bacterium]
MYRTLYLLVLFCAVQGQCFGQKDLTFFGEVGYVQPGLSSALFEKTIDNTTEHMNMQTSGGYTIGIGVKTLRRDTLQGVHFQLNASFSSYYLTNNIKESIASYDAITQTTNTYISNYRYIDNVQYFKFSPGVNANHRITKDLSFDATLALILNTPLTRSYNMYISGGATAGLIYKGIGVFAAYELPFGKLFKTYLDGQGAFSEYTPDIKQSTLIVGLRIYPAILFKNAGHTSKKESIKADKKP